MPSTLDTAKIKQPIDYYSFCLIIQTLCRDHKASVTSWWRTPPRNAAVGGVPDSDHLRGVAADLVPDRKADKQYIISRAKFLGLRAIDEGDHVHIEVN